MNAEAALKEFWFPAEFSSKLTANTMVPFELFDEPWVLFRCFKTVTVAAK
jgi:chlorophyllide a oxygenase